MTTEPHNPVSVFTAQEMFDIASAFELGDYANAYHSEKLRVPLWKSEHRKHAYVLGHFATYEVWEIPSEHLERYQEAYFSPAGVECVRCGYLEPRTQEDFERAGL